MAFFGGNFTGISLQKQEAYLKEAGNLLKSGLIDGIRISTRPDYIDAERIDLLKKYGVTVVELGAQSMNDDVLKASGRGHNARQTVEATQLLQESEMDVVLQMMTGLPGDSPEGAMETARQIVQLKPVATRIYPCLVMKHSLLEKLWHSNQYIPQTLDEAVGLAASLVGFFERHHTGILRIGLHPSSAHEVVAGPFHHAFSELTEAEVWRRLLEPAIDFHRQRRSIIIRCTPPSVNGVAGYNGINRKWLEKHFGTVKFIPDKTLTKRAFYVDYM